MADAVLPLVDHQVQRLEYQVQEPGGEERADKYAVFHQGVAQPEGLPVLEQPFQCLDDIRRVQLLKAVVDVAFRTVPCAGGVAVHPLLDRLDPVGISPSRHACDAVFVHAPHDVRDHGL